MGDLGILEDDSVTSEGEYFEKWCLFNLSMT